MRHITSSNLVNGLDDMFRELNRYAIGFEPLFTRLHTYNARESMGYPPYNLDQDADGSHYRLELAVAGFKQEELEISLSDDRVLVVKGSKIKNDDRTWIHRGIAARDFEKHFTLADRIKVIGAKLEDGLLVIELEREIPEEKKPRRIPIASSNIIDAEPAE